MLERRFTVILIFIFIFLGSCSLIKDPLEVYYQYQKLTDLSAYPKSSRLEYLSTEYKPKFPLYIYYPPAMHVPEKFEFSEELFVPGAKIPIPLKDSKLDAQLIDRNFDGFSDGLDIDNNGILDFAFLEMVSEKIRSIDLNGDREGDLFLEISQHEFGNKYAFITEINPKDNVENLDVSKNPVGKRVIFNKQNDNLFFSIGKIRGKTGNAGNFIFDHGNIFFSHSYNNFNSRRFQSRLKNKIGNNLDALSYWNSPKENIILSSIQKNPPKFIFKEDAKNPDPDCPKRRFKMDFSFGRWYNSRGIKEPTETSLSPKGVHAYEGLQSAYLKVKNNCQKGFYYFIIEGKNVHGPLPPDYQFFEFLLFDESLQRTLGRIILQAADETYHFGMKSFYLPRGNSTFNLVWVNGYNLKLDNHGRVFYRVAKRVNFNLKSISLYYQGLRKRFFPSSKG